MTGSGLNIHDGATETIVGETNNDSRRNSFEHSSLSEDGNSQKINQLLLTNGVVKFGPFDILVGHFVKYALGFPH